MVSVQIVCRGAPPDPEDVTHRYKLLHMYGVQDSIFRATYLRLCEEGAFRCCECLTDLSCKSNFQGDRMYKRPDGEWEAKHMLTLVEEPAETSVMCPECYGCKTPSGEICPCYRRGHCWYGSVCFHRHSGQTLFNFTSPCMAFSRCGTASVSTS